jgi:predicted enzyme related to lactoylglutathione lyase
MVRRIAFTAYSVRDVAAAKAFYRDVVGLTPAMEYEGHWVEFDIDGVAFGIGNGESLGIPPGSSFSVTFEVDNVEKERERLLALGVTVTPINDSPVCWSAFVTDPEGNKFGIHQSKPR